MTDNGSNTNDDLNDHMNEKIEAFDFENVNFDGIEGAGNGDSESDDSGNWDSGDILQLDPDPAAVAFMDQMSAEHNNAQEEFFAQYGFTHNCRCDKDYSSGNMVDVTECYANMAVDALDACARMKTENELLKSMISQAMSVAISDHFPSFGEDVDMPDAEG